MTFSSAASNPPTDRGRTGPGTPRRWRLASLVTACAATLTTLAVLRNSTAWASPPATAKAELAAAFADLDAVAWETRQAGDLPRWSDPAASRILERLWNVPAILGGPPYVAADVPVLLDLAERENAVYKSYALFVAKPGTLPNTAINTYRFQDEIARATAFLLHLQAAEVQALEAFWSSLPPEDRTPVRRAGAAQLRAGLVEFLTGSLIVLRAPSLRADNRAILTDELARTADVIARALPQLDRAAVGAQATATGAALSPEDRARLAPFTAALSRADCTGLCGIE